MKTPAARFAPWMVALMLLTAGDAFATVHDLVANLNGGQEVPANASAAIGTCTVRLDDLSRQVTVSGTYQSLSGTATVAHLHGPATAGTNAPVVLALSQTGGTSGTISGSGTLTIQQVQDMLNGLTYINVHSTSFPGGEIRGQVIFRFVASLNGAQEVPPTASAGTGSATVILDVVTRQVTVSGTYQSLSGTAITAHLHGPALPGTNAPVVLGLTQTGGTSGTMSGNGILTAQLVQDMLNGLTYVNVHSINFPGGEIRGQVLPPTDPADPGSSVLLSKNVGTAVGVSWAPACSASDHVAYWGEAGPGAMVGPLVWISSACGLGTTGHAVFDPGSPQQFQLYYFVVVGQNAGVQGSFGKSSAGVERPEASGIGACDLPQSLHVTCP